MELRRSPLRTGLANIFLCAHEILWAENFHLRFPPKPVIQKRYVNDTALLFQNTDQVEKPKNYLNLNMLV